MRQMTVVATVALGFFAAVPAEAAPLAAYEFGTSGDSTDANDYTSSDSDANSAAGNLVRGSGYSTGLTASWPNVTSATIYDTTTNDWRLHRKSFPTYVEPEGDDGNYLNDYQRAHAAGTNYLEWTVTPNEDYELDLDAFTFDINLGNTTFKFYYYLSSSLSNDNYATVIGSVGGVTSSAGSPSVSLAGPQFQDVSDPVTFRLWTWSGASGGSSNSAWRLDSLTIDGTTSQVPEPSMAMVAGIGSLLLLRRRRQG